MLPTRELLQTINNIAIEAADRIMAVYLRPGSVDVSNKPDQSPLTQADLQAHEVILAALTKLTPDIPVLSEESAHVPFAIRQQWTKYWLVDPLDGTKEFIARNGEFTVNISLIEEGRSVLGVVYAPAIDALYWGGTGLGAFRSIRGETVAIKVTPDNASGDCRVVASKSHLNEATQSFIDRLGSVSLIQAGSSLKFCRVAEGGADIYPRLAPTCEWDTAAAQAVLEGAGGVVLNLLGQTLQYGKPDVLNPSFIAARDRALILA